jgi:hypothetical protein
MLSEPCRLSTRLVQNDCNCCAWLQTVAIVGQLLGAQK